MKQLPFNPFNSEARKALIEAFESTPIHELPPSNVEHGCGVYALFYKGDFEHYQHLSRKPIPIYVGKAVPPGGRKGGGREELVSGLHVIKRLKEHAKSISQTNLKLEDFECRWLSVVEIFITPAEVILIDYYKPLWNLYISGFGIHDPGKGRYNQARSDWDMLHPGRSWAGRMPDGNEIKHIIEKVKKTSLK